MTTDNSPTSFKWLAVFLVYNNALYDQGHENDNTYIKMEDQKNSLFNSIEDTPFDEQIKIIIVEVRTGRQLQGIEQKMHVVEKNVNGFNSLPKPSQIDSDVLVGEKSVVQILSYLINNYKSERHMVITFGHGSIFGINLVPTAQPSLTSIPQVYKTKQVTAPLHEYYWNIISIPLTEEKTKKLSGDILDTNDLQEIAIKKKLNILSNKDLAKALKDVFEDKKLDLLVMYNCLMQNIFTQYEFRETVDYLIAPESGICYPGYSWINVFNNLADKPDAGNDEVAKFFIDTILLERPHRFHPDFLLDVKHTWKIHAVKLDAENYKTIQDAFKALINKLFEQSKTNRDVLRAMRLAKRQLFRYSAYSLPEVKIVDLLILVKYLPTAMKSYNLGDQFDTELSSLEDALQGIEPICFVGDDFYKNEFHYIDIDFSDANKKGIGLWFPEKNLPIPLLMDILNEESDPDLTPSILENTDYASLFKAFIKYDQHAL